MNRIFALLGVIMNVRLIAVFALFSACSAPEYRGAIIKFGEATQAAAKSQSMRLSGLNDRQLADIRGSLALDRVELTYSSGCGLLAVPGSAIKDCIVKRRDEEPIAQPERFTSIEALNKAMGGYGMSISTLAADASADSAAFNKSLTDLATSIDGLNAALDGAGSGATDNAAKLQAGATGLGSLGNALFAGSRVSKLREIIVAIDPQIQEATSLLGLASEALTLTETGAGVDKIEQTRRELQEAISGGAKTQDVAKLQSRLFTEVEELKRIAAVRDTFVVVGKTHAELAKSSRAGASLEDLKASIFELASLVSILTTSSEAF